MTVKAPIKTPAKTLLKLEYLRDTLEGEADLCRRMEAGLSGISSVRRAGMAFAYEKAESALRALIDELESEQ